MTHLDPKRLEAAQAEFNRAYGLKPQRLREMGEPLSEEAIGMLLEWQEKSTTEIITAYLEAGDDWQPIETAPKDTFVLINCVYGGVQRACFYPDNKNQKWRGGSSECYDNNEPTHWQPLPQPPKQGE